MTTQIFLTNSFVYDGAQIQTYHANKGEGLVRHTHTYAHATMCVVGSCVVRKENFERILNAKDPAINLREFEWHEIEALEDGTVFVNIFAEGKT